jgi:hypothetical protein
MDDDWEPPEGMVKRECVTCFYTFASAGPLECPTCRARGTGEARGPRRRGVRGSASPYAPSGDAGGQVRSKEGQP